MKVRALLGLMVASVAMMLTSCGHYVCKATFGSSTCTPSGGGLGGGGTGASGIVFAYLLSDSQNPVVPSAVTMVADKLDLSTNTFVDLGSAFTPPPLPSNGTLSDGGTAVVSLTSQKFLYVPFSDGTVWGFAIDGSTGALTPVPGSPFTATGGSSIAADPAGRFLFVSDSTSGVITAFTINATNGALTLVSGSPFASGIAAAQMTTDGQGKFLYASSGTQVAALAINQSSGALTTVTGSPFPFTMVQVLGEKSGKFLLGITALSGDNHIHVFGINSTSGAIAEVSGSPFLTVAAPQVIVVHPTGSFVYNFNGLGTPMEGYQIGSSGTLTAIAGSPFTSVVVTEGQFDQSGKFLFAAGIGHVGSPDFGPYPTDPSTGVVGATTFSLQGFLGFGFAVSDLNTAP